MTEKQRYREAFTDCLRFLTFRADDNLWDRLGLPHFLIGFAVTWLVGIGRNWDFPEAPLFAKTGLPSVAYIFVLSFILFCTSWLASYERLNYWKILTLVAMTSGPGLVYAIPVEMMFPLPVAQNINMWFLLIVAIWRVALAYYIFIRAAGNDGGTATAILMTPLCGIIIGLVLTGRAGYVIEIMGGNNRPQNVNTSVDELISGLFLLSWPVLIIGLIILATAAIRSARDQRA